MRYNMVKHCVSPKGGSHDARLLFFHEIPARFSHRIHLRHGSDSVHCRRVVRRVLHVFRVSFGGAIDVRVEYLFHSAPVHPLRTVLIVRREVDNLPYG